jgi:hypothetical protein
MTTKTILGIDPGANGAVAVLDDAGQLLDVLDMPSTREANGRTATNAPLLAGILARSQARIAYCEFATKPAIRARSSLRTVLVYGSIMFAERRPPIGATLGRATAPPLRGPFCCGLHLGATIQATAAKPGVIIKISPGRD